jgi:hypothetical protein
MRFGRAAQYPPDPPERSHALKAHCVMSYYSVTIKHLYVYFSVLKDRCKI